MSTLKRLGWWHNTGLGEAVALTCAGLMTLGVAFGLYYSVLRQEAPLSEVGLTLLSSIVASWGALGTWAGASGRNAMLFASASALGSVAVVVGLAAILDAATSTDPGVSGNTAQLVILLISTLLAVAGARYGYTQPVSVLDSESDTPTLDAATGGDPGSED
jgi:hypothetical protein